MVLWWWRAKYWERGLVMRGNGYILLFILSLGLKLQGSLNRLQTVHRGRILFLSHLVDHSLYNEIRTNYSQCWPSLRTLASQTGASFGLSLLCSYLIFVVYLDKLPTPMCVHHLNSPVLLIEHSASPITPSARVPLFGCDLGLIPRISTYHLLPVSHIRLHNNTMHLIPSYSRYRLFIILQPCCETYCF